MPHTHSFLLDDIDHPSYGACRTCGELYDSSKHEGPQCAACDGAFGAPEYTYHTAQDGTVWKLHVATGLSCRA